MQIISSINLVILKIFGLLVKQDLHPFWDRGSSILYKCSKKNQYTVYRCQRLTFLQQYQYDTITLASIRIRPKLADTENKEQLLVLKSSRCSPIVLTLTGKETHNQGSNQQTITTISCEVLLKGHHPEAAMHLSALTGNATLHKLQRLGKATNQVAPILNWCNEWACTNTTHQ